jgi:hypothetical protein
MLLLWSSGFGVYVETRLYTKAKQSQAGTNDDDAAGPQ